MFWIITGSGLGVFIGVRIWKSKAKDYQSPAFGEYTGFSSTIFGGLFGLLLGIAIGCFMTPSERKTVAHEYQLGSLRNSGITGTFFLGTGSIEDGAYYRYYLKGIDGGYRLKMLPSEDERVVVFEEDRSNATLKIVSHRIYHPKNKNSFWTLRVADTDTPLRWEFHIPRGSIQPVFDLR